MKNDLAPEVVKIFSGGKDSLDLCKPTNLLILRKFCQLGIDVGIRVPCAWPRSHNAQDTLDGIDPSHDVFHSSVRQGTPHNHPVNADDIAGNIGLDQGWGVQPRLCHHVVVQSLKVEGNGRAMEISPVVASLTIQVSFAQSWDWAQGTHPPATFSKGW